MRMLVVTPPEFVTLMFLAECTAVAEIVKVVVTVVGFTTVMVPIVMPPPFTFTAFTPVRLVPVRVTETVVPCKPVGGATEVSVGDTTVNAPIRKLELAPPEFVTLTFLAPFTAAPVNVKVAVTVVEFTTVTLPTVTPAPLMLTAVVPVRLVPVRVTETVVPRIPRIGVIEVRLGATTVNAPNRVLVPAGDVRVIFLAVSAAVPEIVKVAVTVEEFTTTMLLTVMPPPLRVTDVVPVRLLPLKVTGTARPCVPVFGEIEVSTGTAAGVTVNAPVRMLLVPPGVVTLTFLAVSAALPAIVKVAVTVVALTTAILLTVMPPPVTVTAVAPVRFVPVRVTVGAPPWLPVTGEIEVSVGGAVVVTVNAPSRMLVVPPGVVTLTFLAGSDAVAEIVKVAVTVDGFTTVIAPIVTPVPFKFIDVVPVR
jgi:hypothetical protein